MSDTTNLDAPTHRSWPAGPGTQVDTGTGVLQTSIPFFSLKGPGRSAMGFGLYHRANQTNANYAGTMLGYAGLAWQPSSIQYVNAGSTQSGYFANVQQMNGGNAASHWYVPSFDSNGNPTAYNRRPGCRADLVRIMSGAVLQGFMITEQADSVKYYYQRQGSQLVAQWYLTKVVDPRGNTVTYGYDGYDRVTQIIDAAGRYATLTWPTAQTGQLSSIALTTTSGTRTWSLDYWTGSGTFQRLKNIVFPADSDGNHPTYHFEYYNANDNIADIFDPRGGDWHYTYGTAVWGGLVVGNVYEPNKTPPASYSYLSPPLNSYDPSSPAAFYYATNISGSSVTATAGSYTYTLPSYFMDCAIVDRLGKLWRHEYDYGVNGSTANGVVNNEWMGNPIRKVVQPAVTDYNGNANHFYYDTYVWDYNQGTLTQHIDPEGRQTDLAYDVTPRDNSGMVANVKRYTGGVTFTWTYGNWYPTGGQPRQVLAFDPDGRLTMRFYDWAHDEMTSEVVDPQNYNDPQTGTNPGYGSYSKPAGLALATKHLYNAQGEVSDTWMASDAHTTFAYDAYGNATRVTDPAGNPHDATYDPWGKETSSSPGAPQGTTSLHYDNLDRLVETDLPGGHQILQTYDLSGNATIATKEDGVTHVTVRYDALNRPVQLTQPVDAYTANDLITLTGYDLRGQRTSVTNPRNKTTLSTYDERGKLVKTTYPDNTTRGYAYDGTGNRVYTTNGRNQRTAYGYDGMNRPTGIDYPVSADVSFGYRNDGLRTQMVDGTGTTTYTYDDAGRLTSRSSPLTGKTLTTTYVPGTNRRRTLAGGAQTWTFAYDSGLRLGSVSQAVGSPTPVSYGAWYADGSVATRTFANGTFTSYAYDSRGRDMTIGHRRGTPGSYTEDHGLSYAYGPDGELQTNGSVDGANTASTTYVHDRAGRLLQESRSSTRGGYDAYTGTYAYDPQGNRTSVSLYGATYPYSAVGANDQFDSGYGRQMLAYDADGNPGTYNDNGYIKYLSYDEMGRVTSISGAVVASFRYDGDGRRVERVVGGATTRFVYDGDQAALETDGGGTVTTYRLPGAGYVKGGVQYYEQEDALGSVAEVRDSSGGLAGQTRYDGWGVSTVANGSERSSQRFAGQRGYQDDDGTGMQWLGSRYYVPQLGRFLTPDPIGQEGGLEPLRLLRELAAGESGSERARLGLVLAVVFGRVQ